MTSTDAGRKLRVFVVAGEHSGDALGAKLMAALNAAPARRHRLRPASARRAWRGRAWPRSIRCPTWR